MNFNFQDVKNDIRKCGPQCSFIKIRMESKIVLERFPGRKKYGLKRNEMKTEIEIYSTAFRFMKYFKKC